MSRKIIKKNRCRRKKHGPTNHFHSVYWFSWNSFMYYLLRILPNAGSYIIYGFYLIKTFCVWATAELKKKQQTIRSSYYKTFTFILFVLSAQLTSISRSINPGVLHENASMLKRKTTEQSKKKCLSV